MQIYKENYTGHDENALFDLAYLSVLGNRAEQQDSFGYELRADEGLVVICDGMGGHEGGRIASAVSVDLFLKEYNNTYPCSHIRAQLIETIENIDRKIAMLTKETGEPMNAGSTLVSVVVRGNTLFWISVGDSRIYLHRNEELVQATQDHIYRVLLDEQLCVGAISSEDYETEIQKGDALVSFLGINGLPQINSNESPLPLQKNDKILLTTDGLFKLVSDEEIKNILDNFSNVEDAVKALEQRARKNAKRKHVVRDNMTVALLQIR